MRVDLPELRGREAVVNLEVLDGSRRLDGRFHRHDALELNLVVRGHAEVALERRRYRIGANAALWLFPGQEHVLLTRSPDFAMWVAVFSPALVRREARAVAPVLASRDPAGSFHRALSSADARALDRLCADLADPGLPSAAARSGHAWLLASAWRAFERAVVIAETGTLHPVVAEALRRLEGGDDEGDAAALARALRVGREWLSRRFRREVGMTLVEYRTRQRLRRFFDRVHADPSVGLLDAALGAGFASYAQFHLVFRRFMDCSPRDYLRRRRSAAETVPGAAAMRRRRP